MTVSTNGKRPPFLTDQQAPAVTAAKDGFLVGAIEMLEWHASRNSSTKKGSGNTVCRSRDGAAGQKQTRYLKTAF